MKEKLTKLALLIFFVAAPMATLWTLWVNPTSAGEDDVMYYYPTRKLVGEDMAAGQMPINNPLEATGVPMLADPQAAVFFPTTWLFAFLPTKLAYSLALFAAFSIAGSGAYVYLRSLKLIRVAAIFGAVVFMFCGFMIGHRVHLTVITAAAFLPWGLACIERQRSFALAGGLCMTPVALLTILAGHWPTLIHVGMIWFVYFLFRARPFVRSVVAMAIGLAIAAVMAAPQLMATADLLAQATRSRVGYGVAGENSYLPTSAVLFFFPFFQGCRTQNFFAQPWWGAWHLCETLGYVGLATLGLAAAAMGKFIRRADVASPELSAARGISRTWCWMMAGAFVFMLGYYLPTYRLIHALPVLGIVRCPSRMILAVQIGLATLAALAIHMMATNRDQAGEQSGVVEKLRVAIRRGISLWVPLGMVTMIAIFGLGALITNWLGFGWERKLPDPFVGGTNDIVAALAIGNPAIWVPIGMLVAAMIAIKFWLGKPASRAWILVLLVAIDVAVVARYVDVPADIRNSPSPERSATADWLAKNASDKGDCRIWGLGDPYSTRQDELLLSRTCQGMGFASISNYGPFHSPLHEQLLGFQIYGTTGDWERLIRTNYLLSEYGVRYVICYSGSEYERVLCESNIYPASQPVDGENLLADAAGNGPAITFDAPPFILQLPWQEKKFEVELTSGKVYRLSMEICSRQGAANFVQADVCCDSPAGFKAKEITRVSADQIGKGVWRRFEKVFQCDLPADAARMYLRLFTFSERAIDIRDISLRESFFDGPVALPGVKIAGPIYQKVAEVSSAVSGKSVAIYENRLAVRLKDCRMTNGLSADQIEQLKWRPAEYLAAGGMMPDISMKSQADPAAIAIKTTLPATTVYLFLLIAAITLGRKRKCSLPAA